MITLPSQFYSILNDVAWQYIIVFLRVAAMISVLPAFGERTIPMRLKLCVAFAFTAIVAPSAPHIGAPADTAELGLLVLSETVTGLVLGLGIRLFVLSLQTAGSIAAQSTSLAQILGGAAVEPIPALGYVLVVAGLALAVMSGLHVEVARMLIGSYSFFPAGGFADASLLSEWGSRQVTHAFALAFGLAAPFVVSSLIYNLALGAINRAMPQLMVAFIGAPVITWGALLILFLAAPAMLAVWVNELLGFFDNPAGSAR